MYNGVDIFFLSLHKPILNPEAKNNITMGLPTKCPNCQGGIAKDELGWSMEVPCPKCGGTGFYDPDKLTPEEEAQEIIDKMKRSRG
jgi:hypothetical protein